MRKVTPEEVNRLRELLRARLFEKAVKVAIELNPRWSGKEPASSGSIAGIGFTLDPLPRASDIAVIFECRPRILAFCSSREIEELRIAVALWNLGAGPAVAPDFRWDHEMKIEAALHNLHMGFMSEIHARGWKASGVVESVKVLTSANGPCEACRKAAEREYSASETPITPVPGCTNMKDGCRCVMAPTKIKGINW